MKYKIVYIFIGILFVQSVKSEETSKSMDDEIYDRLIPKKIDDPVDKIAYSLIVEHLKRPLPHDATEERPQITGYYVLDTQMPPPPSDVAPNSEADFLPDDVRPPSIDSPKSEYGAPPPGYESSQFESSQDDDNFDVSQDDDNFSNSPLFKDVRPPLVSSVSEYGRFTGASGLPIRNLEPLATFQIGSPSTQNEVYQSPDNVTLSLTKEVKPPSISSVSEYGISPASKTQDTSASNLQENIKNSPELLSETLTAPKSENKHSDYNSNPVPAQNNVQHDIMSYESESTLQDKVHDILASQGIQPNNASSIQNDYFEQEFVDIGAFKPQNQNQGITLSYRVPEEISHHETTIPGPDKHQPQQVDFFYENIPQPQQNIKKINSAPKKTKPSESEKFLEKYTSYEIQSNKPKPQESRNLMTTTTSTTAAPSTTTKNTRKTTTALGHDVDIEKAVEILSKFSEDFMANDIKPKTTPTTTSTTTKSTTTTTIKPSIKPVKNSQIPHLNSIRNEIDALKRVPIPKTHLPFKTNSYKPEPYKKPQSQKPNIVKNEIHLDPSSQLLKTISHEISPENLRPYQHNHVLQKSFQENVPKAQPHGAPSSSSKFLPQRPIEHQQVKYLRGPSPQFTQNQQRTPNNFAAAQPYPPKFGPQYNYQKFPEGSQVIASYAQYLNQMPKVQSHRYPQPPPHNFQYETAYSEKHQVTVDHPHKRPQEPEIQRQRIIEQSESQWPKGPRPYVHTPPGDREGRQFPVNDHRQQLSNNFGRVKSVIRSLVAEDSDLASASSNNRPKVQQQPQQRTFSRNAYERPLATYKPTFQDFNMFKTIVKDI